MLRLPLAHAMPVTATAEVRVDSYGFSDVVFQASGQAQIVITEKGSSVDNFVVSRPTDQLGNLTIRTFPAGSYDFYAGSEYQGSFDVVAPSFCSLDAYLASVTAALLGKGQVLDCSVKEKTGEGLLITLLRE